MLFTSFSFKKRFFISLICSYAIKHTYQWTFCFKIPLATEYWFLFSIKCFWLDECCMLRVLVFRGFGVEIVCYGPLDTITIVYAFFLHLPVLNWHLRFYCWLERTAWFHCVSYLVGWLAGLFECWCRCLFAMRSLTCICSSGHVCVCVCVSALYLCTCCALSYANKEHINNRSKWKY